MNKSLQLLLVCSFLPMGEAAFAQKEKNIWYFGDNAGVDFNSGYPVALTNSAMMQDEGCATISDAIGKVLFYTNGVMVWDAHHNVMPNGTGLMGDQSSTQSALIVRKPGSNNLYYIFTAPQEWDSTVGLRYSIVDMALRGGLGDIVNSTKNIMLYSPVTEKLTAIQNCDGNVWVIAHEKRSNSFLAYYVNSSSISTPVISSVGTINDYDIGYLKSSPNGEKLALAKKQGSFFFELFDFNFSSGVVSNPIDLKINFHPYGVSFSPDNSKLYVSPGDNDGPIIQYNLNAGGGNTDSIRASQIPITPAWLNTVYSALQLGPDGKIYVAHNNGYYLGVINNPNMAGMACMFVDSGVDLISGKGVLGLPNFIEGLHVDSTCVCQVLSITTKNHYEASNGECCTELTLHNLFKSDIVYSISATIVSPGVTVKKATGPWNQQPSWSSKNITWSIPPPGLSKGIRDSLSACFNSPNDSLIKIEIAWNDAGGKSLCVDTLILNCKTVAVNETKSDAYSDMQQNYPNPFSSTTTISVNGQGIFEIRDMLGRIVYQTKIIDGKTTVAFDGSRLSNGLYEYSLWNGVNIQSRMMMVLK